MRRGWDYALRYLIDPASIPHEPPQKSPGRKSRAVIRTPEGATKKPKLVRYAGYDEKERP